MLVAEILKNAVHAGVSDSGRKEVGHSSDVVKGLLEGKLHK